MTKQKSIMQTFTSSIPMYEADLMGVKLADGTYQVVKSKIDSRKGIVTESDFLELLGYSKSPIVLSHEYLDTNQYGLASL